LAIARLLLLAAWISFSAGVISIATAPINNAQAHAPFIVDGSTIISYGARAVQANYEQGFEWPDAGLEKVALVDGWGLPAAVKSSEYFPSKDYVWNHDDNLHTWVADASHEEGDSNWQQGGTTVWIDPHDGHSPSATHIHLWTWVWRGYWSWEEWNDLEVNAAYVGYIHLTSSTVYSNPYPESAATVLSHEIGHALGLDDEGGGHSTIMISPNPGVRKPSAADREVEDYCIWVSGQYPC
jgi:hypothetical protein